LIASATAGENVTPPGLEMFGTSGVVTPMIPTRSPPFSTTCEAAIRRWSTSRWSTGSARKSVFAERNGTPAGMSSMSCDRRAGPKSYSWLPIVSAS
jgi:hypothetical protein